LRGHCVQVGVDWHGIETALVDGRGADDASCPFGELTDIVSDHLPPEARHLWPWAANMRAMIATMNQAARDMGM